MTYQYSPYTDYPETWQKIPFSDCCADATSGSSKIKKEDYQRRGVLPIIDQGKEAVGGYVDDLTKQCSVELPCILFGDHTKIFKYCDKPFALGADGVKVLKPTNKFDERFLYHYLCTLKLPDNAGYSRHFKYLRKTCVPLPPLSEQKRIAAILDKADAIRRKRKAALDMADEFLRATFLDMFGDIPAKISKHPWGTVRGLVKAKSGKSSKPVLSEEQTDFPIYGGNGINGWATKPLYSRPVLVLGRVGQQCGITHLTNGPAWVTDNAIVVEVCDPTKLNLTYLKTAFEMSPLRATVQQLDLPFINQTIVLDQRVPMPPIEAQERYEKIYQFIQSRKAAALRKGGIADLTDNLFTSLSQRAFRGEL